MTGIYLIRNKLTSESYIGQSKDIERRWDQHRKNIQGNKSSKYTLYSDMRFYGIDEFEFLVLEECDVKDLLTVERKWIDLYLKNGVKLYNIKGVPQKEVYYQKRNRAYQAASKRYRR